MWEGLLNFAKSGVGQGLIGAGAGYGLSKLSGGKGNVGALLGGLGGLANYGSGLGNQGFADNLFSGEGYNFGNSAIGGMLGGGTKNPMQVDTTGYNLQNSGSAQMGSMIPEQFRNATTQSTGGYTGLLNNPNLGNYGKLLSGVGDVYSGIQQSSTANKQLGLLENSYLNQLATQEEEKKRRGQQEANIGSGFNQSQLAQQTLPSYY